MKLILDESLVRCLVVAQFPKWKDLLIRPVAESGWDNRTFHLGDNLLVRMPSEARYAAQVEKEQQWLPRLAPCLSLPIPIPVAMGQPGCGYPWHWSIYRWLEGEAVATASVVDLNGFAKSLAQFLVALQNIDSTGGPLPGLQNFYRGGALSFYDAQTRQALSVLADKIDIKTATEVWETALMTTWHKPPVWIHGDVSAGNLLVRAGRLSAVIDFGQLGIGDPACDLAIAWTLFKNESRKIFRSTLNLDADTWMRGRAWTLWKAMVVASGVIDAPAADVVKSWEIIEEVLADHART